MIESLSCQTTKSFKNINFIGFKKIWDFISYTKGLTLMSFEDNLYSNLGMVESIKLLFPKIREFRISNNLIHDWKEL